jgi:hypothetical protein
MEPAFSPLVNYSLPELNLVDNICITKLIERVNKTQMEFYAIEMCRSTVQAASLLGAIQLIAVAAIWIFGLSLPKPRKE